MILNIENINKFYNGNHILKNISLSVEDNDRIGLIGVNGCGKSTLLRIITQIEDFDKIDGIQSSLSISANKTLGFLKQNSGLDNSRTIHEEMLMTFSNLIEISNRLKELEEYIGKNSHSTEEPAYKAALDEYSHKSAFFEAQEGYLIEVKIKTILNGMGFANVMTDRLISTLSGGEKTRLALAKLLLENPDLLILDEPTNHLDFKTLVWLEEYLQGYKGALLIVSHDRYFLNKLCSRICEIERGILTAFKGDYSGYLIQKKQLTERIAKEYEQQQQQIAGLNDYIQRNKARASTANMAKSRERQLEKLEIIEKPAAQMKQSKIKLEYDIVPPKDILKVNDLDIIVGEGEKEKLLVKSFEIKVLRGEKVAIIGPNGIGKSTILKYIQNKIPRKKGTVEWARNVKASYFEQENSHLNFNNPVIEELHKRFPRETEQTMRDLLAKVLFTGENVNKPVKVISGGERAKLCFAIMMYERGNVLILDEPTNHLDLATKEILEQALYDYDQTIIFVSHDRYLLNKIATRIVEVTPDGVNKYPGNFDFYSRKKQEEELALQRIEEEQKIEKQRELSQASNIKTYRNKEQRAQEVKKKNTIKQLEMEIDELQENINQIEKEISDPQIYTDFQLMGEKCTLLEEMKQQMSDKYDEWIMLCEI